MYSISGPSYLYMSSQTTPGVYFIYFSSRPAVVRRRKTKKYGTDMIIMRIVTNILRQKMRPLSLVQFSQTIVLGFIAF